MVIELFHKSFRDLEVLNQISAGWLFDSNWFENNIYAPVFHGQQKVFFDRRRAKITSCIFL